MKQNKILLYIRGRVEHTFQQHEEPLAREALARAQDVSSGVPMPLVARRSSALMRRNEVGASVGPYLQYC
jgi:hypothetical protein